MLPAATSNMNRPLLWKGPCSEDPRGGITYSMLTGFLSCRERFRLRYCEGWTSEPRYHAPIHWGSMWHICEEHFAKGLELTDIFSKLKTYVKELRNKFKLDQELISSHYQIVEVVFTAYIHYWKSNPDVLERIPLWQEKSFKTPYTLPSGRIVYLRGKFDAVDIIDGRLFIQENKSKSSIDEESIKGRLASGLDLQTMLYLSVLEIMHERKEIESSVGGVRYNVVRRPSHRQGKKETPEEFIERLAGLIKKEPDQFFLRMKTEVASEVIQNFRFKSLNSILENLCEWYDWIEHCKNTGEEVFHSELHWIHPFGADNSVNDGYSSDLDNMINTGSTFGLSRNKVLFEEL